MMLASMLHAVPILVRGQKSAVQTTLQNLAPATEAWWLPDGWVRTQAGAVSLSHTAGGRQIEHDERVVLKSRAQKPTTIIQ